VTVLASGIDSLYVSARGRVPAHLWTDLSDRKAAAQADDDPLGIEFGGEQMLIRPTGLGRYPMRLDHRYGRIGITRSEKLPSLRFEPDGGFLHGLGPSAAVAWFEALATRVVGPVQLNASRVDVCADVQGWALAADDRHRFVCRASRRDTHENREVFTGFEFGRRRGAGVMARIYDKTLDVERRGTTWWYDIWGGAFDPSRRVLRVEFEFGRSAIRQFQLDTPADVIGSVGDLWRETTSKWLSYRQPTADGTKSRWPVAAEWAAVQGAGLEMPTVGVVRTTKAKQVASIVRLFPAITGYCSSLAARQDVLTIDDALRCVRDALLRYERISGIAFEDRVARKRQELPWT